MVTIKNCARTKGKVKYFEYKLKSDPELLARWQQAVVELNNISYLRNETRVRQL